MSLPASPGILAWGVIAGVTTVAAGIDPLLAWAMCAIVYAGSAQLAALQMLATGTPIVVIGLAALIINSRFVLFSLAAAQQIPGMPLRQRALLGYLLSDNGYGIAVARFASRPDEPLKASVLLGGCAGVWIAYQVGIVIGVVAGRAIPAAWSLEFAVPLTFLALGIVVIRDRAMVVAAIVAGLVAVIAWPLPYRLGLVAAGAAGIGSGMLVDRLARKVRPA